jgi:hypothetical protein
MPNGADSQADSSASIVCSLWGTSALLVGGLSPSEPSGSDGTADGNRHLLSAPPATVYPGQTSSNQGDRYTCEAARSIGLFRSFAVWSQVAEPDPPLQVEDS